MYSEKEKKKYNNNLIQEQPYIFAMKRNQLKKFWTEKKKRKRKRQWVQELSKI